MGYPDVYPDLYPFDTATHQSFPEPKSQKIWYTLDENLRRDTVIEGFQSLIWTERYSAWGDFEIITKSTSANRRLLAPDTWIGMSGSTYVMQVDTVDDKTEEDGKRNLTVTGKSFERLLDDRVAMPLIGGLDETPAWVVTGTPDAIVRQMFHEICVFTILDSKDTIPFFTEGTITPPGNLPFPSDNITVSAGPDTLYNTIKKICDTYGIGFRFARKGELGQMYFEVYTGSDRTSDQVTLPAVIFSPSLENLDQVDHLTSTAVLKTVAYVYSQNGAVKVADPLADPLATGDKRRVLFVNSSNTTEAGPDLNMALQQEGLIALAQNRQVYSFDGKMPPSVPYTYGVDYNLGDLVEERTDDGFGNQLLVTEQIFVSDEQGERSYPTLTIANVITPGSWVAWDGAQYWTDVSPSIHWTDL